MVQIKTTSDVTVNGIKLVVYGPSGSGKTTLCKTAPNPIILSAESGLLSLRKENLPYVEIRSYSELADVYRWAMESSEAKSFDTICLDSLSEIGEVVLSDLKAKYKDPRQAYGEAQDEMLQLIRNFRDMAERHVYFSCKEEDVKDGTTGAIMFRPLMPGTKLPNQIPYFFDEVFNMTVYEDPQTKEKTWALRTQRDQRYVAKDRSGVLEYWEPADLTNIFNKIIHG